MSNKIAVNVWVDGSYSVVDGTPIFGASAVIFLAGRKEPLLCKWSGSDPNWARYHNAAGEILAVCGTLEQLKPFYPQISRILFFHDFDGLSNWINGTWEAKRLCSIIYKDIVFKAMKDVKIVFQYKPAHSGIPNNELADRLAKEAVKDHARQLRSVANDG